VEVIILSSPEKVYKEVSQRIIAAINKKPDTVLGLATGQTMLGVYQEIIAAYNKGDVDFSSVVTFNLDEYLGIAPTDSKSFRFYMEENLFKHVNINIKNINIPSSIPENVEEECEKYEEKIKQKGGIDLQLLGIGRDGHIGFNEPSSSLLARTRVKTLTEETLRDNFGEGQCPRFAITVGTGTILEAREIILVALDEHKAEAIAKTVEGSVSASCPASALQLHPKVKVIIDESASKLLKRKDYYAWVWEHKKEVNGLRLITPIPGPEYKKK